MTEHKLHELKIWPMYFDMIYIGIKTFEVRVNDRDFKQGEYILLKDWLNIEQEYTGREMLVEILSVLHGGKFGIEKGYCIMSIRVISK